ncbi:hypothetical protein [Nonomuraea sp. MTCD27]|uniref:hypothetical protein n=1 Tax=Nonomuraea sp. MTCD27 TaxID=1676747 RepID=UPI0035BEBE3F
MPYDNYGTPENPQYKPVVSMINLVQHYREAEPRVCLGDTGDHCNYYMTLDEAQEIALNLLMLVVAGRDRAEIADSQPPESMTPGCHPWCAQHRPDDICDSGVIEGAWLTHDEGDGALIWFHGYGDDGMSVQHAERLVRAILNLAVLARSTRPAA